MAASPSEYCRDPHRRDDVRAHGRNGIDYIEVGDDRRTVTVYLLREAPENIADSNIIIAGGVRIRDIKVLGVRPRAADGSDRDNCIDVFVDKPGDFSVYTLQVVEADERGEPTLRPFAGFDPRYAQAEFTFTIGASTELDCKQTVACPPPDLPAPAINYLAKDYSSFRQAVLDRLATIMPQWREQHVPDIGIALVEILAYVGDHLSYYQDAVATEAYLATARQRISVRRHVRLIDYAMHEGCNARTWICVQITGDLAVEPTEICFLAGFREEPDGGVVSRSGASPAKTPAVRTDVFEPLTRAKIDLREAHNEISFYTWGNRLCCLPAGATSATLLDDAGPRADEVAAHAAPQESVKHEPRRRKSAAKSSSAQHEVIGYSAPPADYAPPPERPRKLRLNPGDVLLFEEVKGAGASPDPDPAHRHFVRLTSVEPRVDPLYGTPVLEVGWGAEDALPFPLILSVIGAPPACAYVEGVSVARGNIVLADHGIWAGDEAWVRYEDLGVVACAWRAESCEGLNLPADTRIEAGKFRPVLRHGPLTFRQAWAEGAAAGALRQDPRSAVPQIDLFSIPPAPDGKSPLFTFADLQNPSRLAAALADPKDQAAHIIRDHLSAETRAQLAKMHASDAGAAKLSARLHDDLKALVRQWSPRRDLIESHGEDRHFVVEMDNEGLAHLRFGDGDLGRAPEAGEAFAASYRIGIGLAGNIGRETINRVLLSTPTSGVTVTARNPIGATGGTQPESIEKVKLVAPGANHKELQRAITADDYARLAEKNPKVQRAAATLRWTGTRYEAYVAIDPLGTEQLDAALLQQIRAELHRYRRIGHDVVVVPALYVPLDLTLDVDAAPDYLRGHVKAALLDVFGNRVLPDGRRGFFHPDNLTFGQPIQLSRIIAAAQAVPGVESVVVTRLERSFAGPNQEIETGILPISPLEVARLDNDADRPENGRLRINVRGGR